MFSMNKGLAVASLCCLSITSAYASGYASKNSSNPMMDLPAKSGFVFSGGMGFYQIKDMLNNDGDTFFTRLSVEKSFYKKDNNTLGLEVGVQNGNEARLGMTDEQNEDLGGTSIMSTLKPEFDLLLTYHLDFNNQMTSGYVKAGGMYRHLTFDRGTINDLRQINPEFQIGFTQKISNDVSVSLGYQGVYSSGLKLETSSVTETATIKNIPTQHGLLFSVNYTA